MKRDERFYRQDRQYKKARLVVLKRDGHKCKKCGGKKHLCVHHIKKWADYPTLRYDPENLITLCRVCHGKMWGKEEQWESLCTYLVNQEKAMDINYLLWKCKQEEEDE
jgi:5-methylcytosine-specific restriction endonuclease McrA